MLKDFRIRDVTMSSRDLPKSTRTVRGYNDDGKMQEQGLVSVVGTTGVVASFKIRRKYSKIQTRMRERISSALVLRREALCNQK